MLLWLVVAVRDGRLCAVDRFVGAFSAARDARRLEHGLPDQRGRRRRVPEGPIPARASPSASPAPAAASRSSAAARPTSATRRGRSSPTEIDACAKAGIEYIELPIAYDGITIVVNPKNSWVEQHHRRGAQDDLGARRAGQGHAVEPGPRRRGRTGEIHLFGAGVDSGTYDYFTEAIIGKAKASRGDFTSSEDDNVLVQGVSSDELALGFFGFAYYEENKDKLKLVAGRRRQGRQRRRRDPAEPETVRTGTYQPLSRPIFIYVSKKAADRPEVQKFVEFYLAEGGQAGARGRLRRAAARRLQAGRGALRPPGRRDRSSPAPRTRSASPSSSCSPRNAAA